MLSYKIVMGDSRQMPEVESNTVSLVVTSPPYWHLDVFSKEGDKGAENDLSRILLKEDFFEELTRVWAECERVLVPGGILVVEWEDYPPGSRVYGYPREICICGDIVRSVERARLYLISRWIWKKFESGVALNKFQYTMWSNLKQTIPRAVANWAYCYAFYKRYSGSRKRELDFNREEWKLFSDGIWDIEAKTSGAGAVISGGAVYPVELISRFIRIFTMPRDVVLDPFLGTGTTMLASRQLSRSCVGFEVLEKMLPVIKGRVEYGKQRLDEEVEWKIIVRR